MSISQSSKITAADIAALITALNDELTRREYNPDLSGETITRTAGNPDKINAADGIAITTAISNITTTAATIPSAGRPVLADFNLINDEIATYATANITDATTYCASSCAGLCLGCTGSCLGQCLTTCTASCADDCTSTCTNACGSSCGSDCAKNSNCSNDCAVNCAAMCSGSCSGACGNNCTRVGNCTITCASWCKAQSSA